MWKVLVATSDALMLHEVSQMLCSEGYGVATSSSADECLWRCEREPPDLVVFGPSLEGGTGFAVLRRLREESQVPAVLILSQKSALDLLLGLELGADRCVPAQTPRDELLATIRPLLRWAGQARSQGSDREGAERIEAGYFTLYPEYFDVEVDGRRVGLDRDEFFLIHALLERRGEYLGVCALWKHLYGGKGPVSSVRIARLFARLRDKLEPDPARPRYFLFTQIAGEKRSYKLAPGDRYERGGAGHERPLTVGPICIYPEHREALVYGRRVDLTPTQMRLLQCFAERPGEVLAHTELWKYLYGDERPYKQSRVAKVVSELRQQLEADPDCPQLLATRYGRGGGCVLLV